MEKIISRKKLTHAAPLAKGDYDGVPLRVLEFIERALCPGIGCGFDLSSRNGWSASPAPRCSFTALTFLDIFCSTFLFYAKKMICQIYFLSSVPWYNKNNMAGVGFPQGVPGGRHNRDVNPALLFFKTGGLQCHF